MYNQNQMFNPYGYYQQNYQQEQFDFNGKYVDGIEEAKKFNNSNLPVVSLDRTRNYIYMSANGQVRTFEYKEIKSENTEQNDISEMKSQIAALTDVVNKLVAQTEAKG